LLLGFSAVPATYFSPAALRRAALAHELRVFLLANSYFFPSLSNFSTSSVEVALRIRCFRPWLFFIYLDSGLLLVQGADFQLAAIGVSLDDTRPIVKLSLGIQLGVVLRVADADVVPKNSVHCGFSLFERIITHVLVFVLFVVTRIVITVQIRQFIANVMLIGLNHAGKTNLLILDFVAIFISHDLLGTTATTLDSICVRCIIHTHIHYHTILKYQAQNIRIITIYNNRE